MPKNPCPDETAVFDLALAHRKIAALFGRDGVIDDDEHHALELFDGARERLSTSYRRRRAFEAWMRNGDNDYTRRLARQADVTFVEGGKQAATMATIGESHDTLLSRATTCCDGHPPVELRVRMTQKERPMEGTPPDAA